MLAEAMLVSPRRRGVCPAEGAIPQEILAESIGRPARTACHAQRTPRRLGSRPQWVFQAALALEPLWGCRVGRRARASDDGSADRQRDFGLLLPRGHPREPRTGGWARGA